MASNFALAEGCEPLIEVEDLTVFTDPDGVERAVFLIDGNHDPLPHCNPNDFGYALTMINFIDGNEGVAICEVVNIREWLEYNKEFGLELVDNL
ncbi:hypothetical protein GCM10009700_35000 [Brevibacterium sanguinis]|uniref:hypothetical protein n=1 Tax=Brevibacterium sanguinis TaxID=232444 RepID=UPI0031E2A81E